MDEAAKREFQDFDSLLIVNRHERLIAEDLNGHVGRDRQGYEEVHGALGLGRGALTANIY